MGETMQKVKSFVTVDIVLVFILGFSLGLYMKNLAQEHITIGHSDPHIASDGSVYDIDVLEQSLISRGIPPTAPDGTQNTELLNGEGNFTE